MKFFGIIASLLIYFISVTPIFAVTNPPCGVDYVFYDYGDYIANPTAENQQKFKLTIPHYNQNPDLINKQLASFCQMGLTKAGLTLMFQSHSSDHSAFQLGWVNARDGNFSSLIQNNITQLIRTISSLKNSSGSYCYDEIQFRFNPVTSGTSDPIHWETWNETKYLDTKIFIFKIHDLVKNSVINPQLKVIFDLGVELSGRDEKQNIPYMKRLWRDYTAAYGTSDTYGFSMAWAPGRLTKMIGVYDEVGIRPSQHAISLYEPLNTTYPIVDRLKLFYEEMQKNGEGNKQILVQETYFSDQSTFDQIALAQSTTGMNVRAIMQWQIKHSPSVVSGVNREFTPFIGIPANFILNIPGDLNSDGHVNSADYTLFLAGFGTKYTLIDYAKLVAGYGR